MKWSIVIPNKNREKQLENCLLFLSQQNYKNADDFEIIVVDGGSDDGSLQHLEKYGNIISNLVVCNENKKEFNISNIRNVGLKKATGKYITFLDVDMIIPNNFIEIMISKYFDSNWDIICHYVYGFGINFGDREQEEYKHFTSFNLKEMVKDRIEFQDFRESVFSSVYNLLDKLSAPWVYGWSTTITIKKEMLEKYGGFDTSLTGWGSEDTELAYRLYKNDAKFVAEPDAFAVHVPHEVIANKNTNNLFNRKKIFYKYKTIETELYVYLSGVNYNNILNLLNHLYLGTLNPIYNQNGLNMINDIIQNTKSLSIGLDSKREIENLQFTDYFVINDMGFQLIKSISPNSIIHKSIGLITQFSDNHFDNVVVFDSYKYLLPKKLESIFYTEIKRISKNVYTIKTERHKPILYNFENISDVEVEKLILKI